MSDEISQRSGSKHRRDSLSIPQGTPNRDMPQIYEFGPFRLEPSERKLLRGNEIVVLTPKAFDTLVLLVLNSGRLLNKDELISMIWPDSFVEEGSLSNNIFLLRKALGEDPAFIETVPRRGYRFVGGVRQLPNIAPAPVGDFTESPHPMETLPRRGYGSIGPLPPSATNPAGEAAVRRHATTLITAAVFPVLAIGAAAWTLPRRAYRFIGKTDARGHGQENKRPNHLRTAIAGAALVLVLGGPLLAYFWSRPAAVPKVSNYVQLTHGGQLKSLVGTDGARLYLGVGADRSGSFASITPSPRCLSQAGSREGFR